MKSLLAPALYALRRAKPAFAGFAASAAFTDTTLPLRKFPENRFNAIIGGLAVLVLVVGIAARAFSRRFAHRHRPPARLRLEPTLLAHDAPAPPPPDTSGWSLELLNALESRRFESVCAACFESLGYEVRFTPHGAERRVDLRLHRQGAERASILVRCRSAHGAPTDGEEARELLDALADEEVPEGILVTSSDFTVLARALADGRRLRLIDGRDLLWKIGRLGEARQRALLERTTTGDFATPTCRVCGATARRCAHRPGAARSIGHADSLEAEYSSRIVLL
jgi:hypothetical protein